MIQVRQLSEDEYEVRVRSAVETVHRVTLRAADRERFAGCEISAAQLIETSFQFLLEREPNTSILAAFELPVIGRYFPEYEREISARLRASDRP